MSIYSSNNTLSTIYLFLINLCESCNSLWHCYTCNPQLSIQNQLLQGSHASNSFCFVESDYVSSLIESLTYCQKEKGLLVHAYCIMPNHLHLIISAANGNSSDVIRDFKKFTSAKVLKTIEENNKESRRKWMLWIFKKAGVNNNRNTSYQFWHQENHPIECSTEDILGSTNSQSTCFFYLWWFAV